MNTNHASTSKSAQLTFINQPSKHQMTPVQQQPRLHNHLVINTTPTAAAYRQSSSDKMMISHPKTASSNATTTKIILPTASEYMLQRCSSNTSVPTFANSSNSPQQPVMIRSPSLTTAKPNENHSISTTTTAITATTNNTSARSKSNNNNNTANNPLFFRSPATQANEHNNQAESIGKQQQLLQQQQMGMSISPSARGSLNKITSQPKMYTSTVFDNKQVQNNNSNVYFNQIKSPLKNKENFPQTTPLSKIFFNSPKQQQQQIQHQQQKANTNDGSEYYYYTESSQRQATQNSDTDTKKSAIHQSRSMRVSESPASCKQPVLSSVSAVPPSPKIEFLPQKSATAASSQDRSRQPLIAFPVQSRNNLLLNTPTYETESKRVTPQQQSQQPMQSFNSGVFGDQQQQSQQQQQLQPFQQNQQQQQESSLRSLDTAISNKPTNAVASPSLRPHSALINAQQAQVQMRAATLQSMQSQSRITTISTNKQTPFPQPVSSYVVSNKKDEPKKNNTVHIIRSNDDSTRPPTAENSISLHERGVESHATAEKQQPHSLHSPIIKQFLLSNQPQPRKADLNLNLQQPQLLQQQFRRINEDSSTPAASSNGNIVQKCFGEKQQQQLPVQPGSHNDILLQPQHKRVQADLSQFVTQINQPSGIPPTDKTVVSTIIDPHKINTINPYVHAHKPATTNSEITPRTISTAQKEYHKVTSSVDRNANILLATPTSTITKIIKPNYADTFYVSSILNAFSNTLKDQVAINLAKEHLAQTMLYIQAAKMFIVPPLRSIEAKRVHFAPLTTKKKTLIFDLDETLIHCNPNLDVTSDITVKITFPTGEQTEAGINIRPYAAEILAELSKIYEIVVFTASHSCYANVVLDRLDPKKEYISYRLFREHCVHTEQGLYVKDLRVIANRSLDDMIIVDNAAYSFGFQIDNGLPIIPYYDNKDDQELKYLIDFMKSISNVGNVREELRNRLKVHSYSDYQQPEELLRALYGFAQR